MSFQGRWRPKGSDDWKTWTGKRVEARPDVLWLVIVEARWESSLEEEERFPISGYTTTVDWDASAISDFIYLSMLLIRRMDPVEAVRQTYQAAPYTGKTEIEDCAIISLGLEILTPEDVARK